MHEKVAKIILDILLSVALGISAVALMRLRSWSRWVLSSFALLVGLPFDLYLLHWTLDWKEPGFECVADFLFALFALWLLVHPASGNIMADRETVVRQTSLGHTLRAFVVLIVVFALLRY